MGVDVLCHVVCGVAITALPSRWNVLSLFYPRATFIVVCPAVAEGALYSSLSPVVWAATAGAGIRGARVGFNVTGEYEE